jgi:hypothetical protein
MAADVDADEAHTVPQKTHVKLASAEKALFDLAYLSGGRSRLFTAVPELEIGKTFRWPEPRRRVSREPSRRARSLVEEREDRAGRRPTREPDRSASCPADLSRPAPVLIISASDSPPAIASSTTCPRSL